ncbi:YdcF family protein [Macrococcus lamae]|uniref:YdcF family protein n=1 Tax=Macrococcus lamae TaxID=198484 RepID=A0A4R6BVZ6_9STAP|nr:YdcF family protein [Macrococcus lamae]TDM12379.1 YdcF family protein [Macrococcus lamae]
MKNKKRTLLIVLGILVLLALIAAGSAVYAYNHVSQGEKPVKSDVIIMIDGGDTNRWTQAGKLYQEKYAPKVMVSPVVKIPGIDNVQAMVEAGVPKKDLILEKKATSTWTNATNTLALMKKNNMKSAIVVTSDYHTARTKLAYDRADKNNDYDITVVGIKDKDGNAWNETDIGKSLARGEVVKLFAYWFGLYKFIDL